MTQDTRKDKRAKIVSLNVRYKSATVDEFIENHSHDVSKGGLFIKTPTPFPPGTLIKFEIRIAGDKSVIAGVGRVVWKREAGQAAGERPAGMGVKFIKIDDASRTLIDRVVLEKSDAGREYDENPADAIVISAEVAAAADAHDRERGAGPQHKATMMGLGSVGGTPAARTAPAAPRASTSSGGGGMFPATNSIGDMPEKKERTVMKQAAELLEEALKEAGGSMDDVGSNPLFAAAQAVGSNVSPIVEPPREVPKSTLIGMPAARDVVSDRLEAAPRATGNLSPMSSDALRREAGAAAAIAKNVPHPEAREAPYADAGLGGLGGIAGGGITPRAPAMEDEGQATSRQRKTDPPARRSGPASAVVAIEEEPRPAKKGSGALLWVGLIVVAGAGVAYFYKDTLLGTPPAPPPPVTAAATAPIPPTIPPPPVTATTPSTATGLSATEAPEADAAIASVDAGPVKDAAASKVAAPAPAAAPVPATPAPATASPRPSPPPPRPRPVVTAPAEGATAAPPPKPKPAPKPASTDDDNPY